MDILRFSVPAGQHPGACAASEPSRYAIDHVVYAPDSTADIGFALLIATDGKILSINRVEGDAPAEPLLLPRAAVDASMQRFPDKMPVEVTGAAAAVEVRTKQSVSGRSHDPDDDDDGDDDSPPSQTHSRYEVREEVVRVRALPAQDGRFPHVKAIMPDRAALERCVAVAIDAELLKRLSDALSSDLGTLTLLIDTTPDPAAAGVLQRKAIVAVGHDGDHQPCGVGAIMPLDYDATKIKADIGRACELVDALPNHALYFGTEKVKHDQEVAAKKKAAAEKEAAKDAAVPATAIAT